MKKICIVFIFTVVIAISGNAQNTALPTKYSNIITSHVSKIYPNSKIKNSDTKTSYPVLVSGKQIAKLHILQGKGLEDTFDFMVLIDNSNIVKRIEVLSYSSKFGVDATKREWLKQFDNKKVGSFARSKNIDAISGGTLTVDEIITKVNNLSPNK